MNPASYHFDDGVATITMDDGKANVIAPAMVAGLNEALDRAEQEASVVVLRGREGMFSGGFDLAALSRGVDQAVELVQSGSELTGRLMRFPRPVIGASCGHAVAMGAFILMACDYRLGLAGEFKYGLNEVAIGITIPQVGLALARERLAQRLFNRAVMNAEMFAPQNAVEVGFLDEAVDAHDFEAALQCQVAHLKTLDRNAFKNTKLSARREFFEHIEKAIAQDAEAFRQLAEAMKPA